MYMYIYICVYMIILTIAIIIIITNNLFENALTKKSSFQNHVQLVIKLTWAPDVNV